MDTWGAMIRGRARTSVFGGNRRAAIAAAHPWTARAGSLLAATVIIGSAALGAGCGADQTSSPNASPGQAVATAVQLSGSSAPTSSAATGSLSGKWRDEKGNIYDFTSSGPDSYAGEVADAAGGVCTPINIKVAGHGGHFEGTMAFYKVVNSACGAYLGDGTVLIDLEGNGSAAAVRWTGPSGGGNCLNCTPHTWTRYP